MFIASLPWYDLPEIKSTTDIFWQTLAKYLQKEGIDAPSNLCRDAEYTKQWQSEKLLLSQACGYDVIKPFIHDLKLIATPCYSVDGCKEHYYSSFIIVHRQSLIQKLEHLNQKTCAVNCQHSHSGMNILRFIIATQFGNYRTFFSKITQSGSHENSIEMILKKEIDVAAIDCVTYQLFKEYRPKFLEDIRIIYHTPYAPGPPYVINSSCSDETLSTIRECLRRVFDDKNMKSTLKKLFLKDTKLVSSEEYQIILEMEKKALIKENDLSILEKQ